MGTCSKCFGMAASKKRMGMETGYEEEEDEQSKTPECGLVPTNGGSAMIGSACSTPPPLILSIQPMSMLSAWVSQHFPDTSPPHHPHHLHHHHGIPSHRSRPKPPPDSPNSPFCFYSCCLQTLPQSIRITSFMSLISQNLLWFPSILPQSPVSTMDDEALHDLLLSPSLAHLTILYPAHSAPAKRLPCCSSNSPTHSHPEAFALRDPPVIILIICSKVSSLTALYLYQHLTPSLLSPSPHHRSCLIYYWLVYHLPPTGTGPCFVACWSLSTQSAWRTAGAHLLVEFLTIFISAWCT